MLPRPPTPLMTADLSDFRSADEDRRAFLTALARKARRALGLVQAKQMQHQPQ